MRIRKSAAKLPASEQTQYVNALKAIKSNIATTLANGTPVSEYDQLVALHLGVTRRFDTNDNPIGDGAHNTPAFLPWHRQYMLDLEALLRKEDPAVSIPYWDWANSQGAQNVIFQDAFMGPAGSGIQGVVSSGHFTSSAEWTIINELHRPNLGTLNNPSAALPANTRGTRLLRSAVLNFGTLPTLNRINQILGRNSFEGSMFQAGFRADLEGDPHGRLHGWVGGGGTMNGMSSPNDPIFFLHHAAVDWIWARWQDDGHADPSFYPLNVPGTGHGRNSPMWPWDSGQSKTHDAIEPYLANYAGTVTPAEMIDYRALGFVYDTQLPQLGIGQTASAVPLAAAGDEMGFRVDIVQAGQYRIQKQGATEVTIGLYGPDSWELFSQASGAGLVTLEAHLNPGSYYAVVRHASPAGTGSFSLTLTQPSVVVLDTLLTVDGSTVQAGIGAPGETDVYRFNASTFGQYTIETDGPTDVVMSLYGPNDRNSLVVSNDDGGQNFNAKIDSQLSAGEYHVDIRHYFPTQTGQYGISVKTAAATAPSQLQVDGPEVQGEIGVANESDVYAFQVPATGTYVIEMSGPTDTFLSLFGPDSETTLWASDDDSGPGLLSRIEVDLVAGTYYARVRHYSWFATGSYGIRIRTI